MKKTAPKRAAAPRTRARRLDPTERRAQLMQCAIRAFARRGIGAARHAEIAREAGVAIPTVFFYFPTRTDLVRAVLDEVARYLIDMAERIHTGDRPAPEVVLEHAREFARSVDERPEYARVWLDWSTAVDDKISPRYQDFQERMVGIIAKTIRRWRRETGGGGIAAAEDDARLVVASAHMLALMKFTRSDNEKVEGFLRALVRSAIGIAPEEPARRLRAIK